MSQGVPFTPEQRAAIIESLKPYLEMGFSRNKACAFIGLDPSTLSKWATDDEALSMKLTSWENVNSALALAVIHQTIQNEKIQADEHGSTRAENSWKLVSTLEDGYKDKLDLTTNDKDLPVPILATPSVLPNNSNEEDSGAN
jgi:hypothetical protein